MNRALTDNYTEYYEMGSSIEQEDEEEIRFFSSLIEGKKECRVLDIGCAEGKLATILSKGGHDVTAIDISQHYIDEITIKSKSNSLNIKAFCCDIEGDCDPINGMVFDVIFIMDVIEHLRNPAKALSNIRNLMNESSILIINTPNSVTPSRISEYLIHPKKLINYYEPRNLNDLHLQTYDYFTLEKTLNFVGLRVKRFIPNSVTFPYVGLRWTRKIGKMLSRKFPFFSDYVLVSCERTEPIDVEKQLEYWKTKNIKAD